MIFDINKWLEWLKQPDNAFNKIPDNGIVGIISNASGEDILIISRKQDQIDIRTSKILEEQRNPVVDIVFIVNNRHFDLILSSKFEQFKDLVSGNQVTASPLISLEKLQTKNYLEFIGEAGLTIKVNIPGKK